MLYSEHMSTPIPTADEIRIEIRARAAELRALRRLLRLTEAAETVRQARDTRTAATKGREVSSASR